MVVVDKLQNRKQWSQTDHYKAVQVALWLEDSFGCSLQTLLDVVPIVLVNCDLCKGNGE